MKAKKTEIYIANDETRFFDKGECLDHEARLGLEEVLAGIDSTNLYKAIIDCYQREPKDKTSFNRAVIETIMAEPEQFADVLRHHIPVCEAIADQETI